MRGSAQRLLLLIILIGAAMPSAVTASSTSTAGTLALNVTLSASHGRVDPSPDCTPLADECAGRTLRGPFPGLGQVDGRYDFPMARCADGNIRALAHPIKLSFVGKGDIQVAVAGGPCVDFVPSSSLGFAVTGGTGIYAGASGSGTLVSVMSVAGPPRFGTVTWTGTLVVPGLEFDVTAPTLRGATAKTVRALKGAKSVRVTYNVTASDNVDPTVPVSCFPRSGFRFPIGRTTVKCSATDTSANTGRAAFSVTVRRTR